MGGAVLVGVRRLNGREHLCEAWTNPMPQHMAQLSYLSEDAWCKAFGENNWVRKSDRLSYGTVKSIRPVGYGVILIDFQTSRVLSRQDYTDVRRLIVACRSTGNEEQIVLTAASLHTIREIRTFPAGRRVSNKARAAFMASCRQIAGAKARGERYDAVRPACEVEFYQKLVIDQKSVKASAVWPEVRAWLKTAGWKSRIATAPSVESEK